MQVYLGIDWSEKKHDLAFVNGEGKLIAQLRIAHKPEGFARLEELRAKVGVAAAECVVGLETAHNLLIDYLWSQGYSQVYVIPPSVVKSSRGRFGSSGARTDVSDARLLADLLRTDRARLQPWKPDGLHVRQMRALVSRIMHLTSDIVRQSNRLRAVLLRYYPAAMSVFSELTSQIGLHFIRTYPTPQAARLTWAEFAAFAEQHHYSQPRKLPACYARLQASQPLANLDTTAVYQDEAVLLAELLLFLVQAKHVALRDLASLFGRHEDNPVFASLPGTGKFLAPALLAKFGEDRARFPTPASIQALAGTCPVTAQSGKRKVIKFRRACDHELRFIAQQWAKASLTEGESVWASTYWEEIRPQCHSANHAYRCLANRWLAVAWRLWQEHTLYGESVHLKNRAARRQPRT